MECITINADEASMRLDRMLRNRFAGLSQGAIEKHLRQGKIRVNGKRIKAAHRLAAGEEVSVPHEFAEITPRAKSAPPPAPEVVAMLRQGVIYENNDFLALNKPSGLAVQGGAETPQHIDGALSTAFAGGADFRLVHRLDRDTSGVLLVAKTTASARKLAQGFAGRGHKKTYLALVLGTPPEAHGIITAPLIKAGGRGHEKMVVDAEAGKPAETAYTCLESHEEKVSLMLLEPRTGRTHQLRAHTLSIGCPILGDGKYGGRAAFPHQAVKRLCLHAVRLDIVGAPPLIATLPSDFCEAMQGFGFDSRAVMAMIKAGDA